MLISIDICRLFLNFKKSKNRLVLKKSSFNKRTIESDPTMLIHMILTTINIDPLLFSRRHDSVVYLEIRSPLLI